MKVTTFLMFTGKAEEAMTYCASLVPGSKIGSMERYVAGEAGPEGSVKQALLDLAGTKYMFTDSPMEHAFTFTPSISLFLEVDSREHFDKTFASLSDGGEVLMPPGDYGFSTYFAWVQDRFGVSWQLNFP